VDTVQGSIIGTRMEDPTPTSELRLKHAASGLVKDMAGVSIRKSIRWLPEDASEPTSTIVLSSAERRFVDIRILELSNGESENDIGKIALPSQSLTRHD
jgi:hypothetical protein